MGCDYECRFNCMRAMLPIQALDTDTWVLLSVPECAYGKHKSYQQNMVAHTPTITCRLSFLFPRESNCLVPRNHVRTRTILKLAWSAICSTLAMAVAFSHVEKIAHVKMLKWKTTKALLSHFAFASSPLQSTTPTFAQNPHPSAGIKILIGTHNLHKPIGTHIPAHTYQHSHTSTHLTSYQHVLC